MIGYLLGSVSPAYFLGRWLKNVDIRKVGDKNAGTTNVYRILGIGPAVITALYDVLKGLLAMLIAYYLGVPELIIYLAGYAAIVGHVFPFYLGFRGGQGSATAVGMLFYFLYVLFKDKFLPIDSLVILGVVTVAILVITHSKYFIAFVVLPALIALIGFHYELNLVTIFTILVLIQLFSVTIYAAYRDNIFKLKKTTLDKIRPWRTFMRPLASVFPIGYYFLDKKWILLVIGIIGGIFVLADLVRLLSPKINLLLHHPKAKIYKKGEEKHFSSISLFLVSAFVVIFFFPKSIALVSLVFLIFGDVFAKLFGLEFGQIKIFPPKTLEGSLAHLTVCLLAGYLLWPYVDLSAAVILAGAVTATIVEALPLRINDNFSVSISSAVVMLILNRWI